MKNDQIKFCENLTNGLVVEVSTHRQQFYDLFKSIVSFLEESTVR